MQRCVNRINKYIILDIVIMITQDHLLRLIKNCTNIEIQYEKAVSYNCNARRKSKDSVNMIEMLLYR